MLSVAKLSGNLDYYLELATLDYYQSGGEPVGKWFGQGAERLNLHGEIDHEVIRRIGAGFSTDGTRKLVQNAGKEDRQIGWDLTFSAPKSVSVLWSVAVEDIRHEIQEAHEAAVCGATNYLEKTSAFSRVGKAGKERKKVGLVVGLFEHGSSRANDANLHTHALVLNVGLDEAGETRSIVSKPLYQKKMTAGALYRTELAHQLVKRLGVRLEQSGFAFEIKGVPKPLCEFHSKRRKEVVEALRAANQSSAKAAQIATLETRRKKDAIPRSELFVKWAAEAATFGFGVEEVYQTIGRGPIQQRPEQSTQDAFTSLMAQHSYFSEAELVRETAIRCQAEGVSIAGVLKTVDQFLTSNNAVRSITQPYFTSKENLELEERLIVTANRLATQSESRVTIKQLESKLLKHEGIVLNWEQSAALGHVILGEQSISLVSGKAGTGKTRMLKIAAELWAGAGYDILGVCIAGKAARGLNEATGIKTDTVAKLLYDQKGGFQKKLNHHIRQLGRVARKKKTFSPTKPLRLTAQSILIVDEAAMLGTKDMSDILELVDKAGAKVVLIGDAKQLQPISAGNPFLSLVERLGAVQLGTIVRQFDAFDRQVVEDLSNGRAQDAISNLDKRGLVHCAENRESAIKQLIDDWAAACDPKSLILVPTRAEATKVNRQCQRRNQRRGTVRKGIGVKVQNEVIHLGDRIQFLKRNRGLRIENGDFATVEHVNPLKKSLVARLDSGEKILIPLKKYDAISLGYATTVHKGQGATVDRSFVLLGGHMQDLHLSYVQLSRARLETRVYIDRFEAGQDYADLLASMERNRQRPMAIDLAEIHEALSQSQSQSP